MWRKQLSTIFFISTCSGLLAQPTFTVQPVQVVVNPGQSATFSVTATADCPLTYQWQFDGTNLPNGIITTVAGDGRYIYGDGGPATMACLNGPHSLALDSIGNIYVADTGNNLIRLIGTNGIITRIAGAGSPGGFINPGLALGVSLNSPTDICLDSAGNYYFSDQLNHRVCKVDTNGNLSIFAGINQSTPHPGFSGDGGPAYGAGLNRPVGLTFDAFGNLYIADRSNNRIRKVDTNGIITTVAGSGGLGGFGYSGDGGYATNGVMNAPGGVAFDAAGNMFIADTANNVIRKVDTNGIITTVAGNGTAGFEGDNGPATNAFLNLPESVMVDPAGNLLISAAGSGSIRRVDTNGIITTIVSLGFSSLTKVVMDSNGNLFIAAQGRNQILKRDTNGVFTVMGGTGSGSYTGDGGPANTAYLAGPTAVVADPAGKLIIADQNYNRIRQVSPLGIISTIGGTNTGGFSGDGGNAINAKLNGPFGVVLDAAGNVFFSDSNNQRVRKIDVNGIITTVAGNGTNAFAGDNGSATNASLNGPAGLAIDALGNLFIADYNNYRIRKVDTNGIITTVAGSSTNVLYAGNGGYATNAGLYRPRGVAVDAVGNLFIADAGNNRIRKVDTNGIITLLAGTNSSGFSGDGGLALTNKLALPAAVAVDGGGNVFIADEFNTRIRKIGTNGIMTTVAGNANGTFAGDGGPATNASLSLPLGISFDSAGNLLIADYNNYRVRKVVYSDKPTFTVLGVNSNNIGDYQVVVSGACGSITSSVAKLFLLPQIQTGNTTLGVQGNGFGFAVTGSSNQIVVIEAATNLDSTSWQPMATNTLGADPYYFTDPEWTNHAQRFYRVRTP
jgi:trimeric autotransporter adhesin